MEEVNLNNKLFEKFISQEEIEEIINILAKKINSSKLNNPIFLAILNGSFLFAADIMRKITIPNAEISFIKLSSYSGTKSTGLVNELIGINKDISKRNIVVLEDIIDTGNTLEKIIFMLKENNVSKIKIAALLYKPEAYTKKIKIDFVGKEISNDFVVGYGLDYDEIGRNLPHIYKLKE